MIQDIHANSHNVMQVAFLATPLTLAQKSFSLNVHYLTVALLHSVLLLFPFLFLNFKFFHFCKTLSSLSPPIVSFFSFLLLF